jgi:hypothetical protein
VALVRAWRTIAAEVGLGRVREVAASDANRSVFVFDDGAARMAIVDAPALDDLDARADELRPLVDGDS